MKIRTDFVTNSSSSSFILAFEEDERWKSYENFTEICEEYDYEKFFNLIENLKRNPENMDKDSALEFLFNYYTHDYKWELLESMLDKSSSDYYKKCIEMEKTPAFKAKLVKYARNNPEYTKKAKQIADADFVIQGTIWDTSGGLLEWAIRNGFVEDNFRGNHVLTWNIG